MINRLCLLSVNRDKTCCLWHFGSRQKCFVFTGEVLIQIIFKSQHIVTFTISLTDRQTDRQMAVDVSSRNIRLERTFYVLIKFQKVVGIVKTSFRPANIVR